MDSGNIISWTARVSRVNPVVTPTVVSLNMVKRMANVSTLGIMARSMTAIGNKASNKSTVTGKELKKIPILENGPYEGILIRFAPLAKQRQYEVKWNMC